MRDEEVRTLREEKQHSETDGSKDPLHSKQNSVRVRAGQVLSLMDDNVSQALSEDDTPVYSRCDGATERQGSDFCTVGRCDGDEHPEGNSGEDFPAEEHGHVAVFG